MAIKKCVLSAALLVSFASASFAGSVATVDMQAVFKGAPQAKQIEAQLKKQFQSRQEKLIKMQDALKKDQKEIKKNKPTATKEHLEMLNKNFVQDLQAFQKEQTDYKKAVYDSQTEAMKKFTDHVSSVVGDIAKKKHLDAVFPKRVLLYSGPDLDLTDFVIAVLEKDKKA